MADQRSDRAADGSGTGSRSDGARAESTVIREPSAIPRARARSRPAVPSIEHNAIHNGTLTAPGQRAAPGQRPAPARRRAPGDPPPAVRRDSSQQVVPDDPGFREYVAARGRSLLRTAYLLTGNVADAEDLVQSALAKTYLAWDRIEDRAALDGYVRRAIVNTHISWWRRRRVEEYPTDDIPDQAVADHAIASDLQESLRSAIDRLPQRMRAAVVLRYYEDMTETEVAEALGVSLGTVKSTVSRAVAKLRADTDLQ
jgi:RNA polymerase sigma-70 factor (sigma-E family)